MITYIAIVLTIYVGLWLWRTYKPFNKKSYFNKQIKDLGIQEIDIENIIHTVKYFEDDEEYEKCHEIIELYKDEKFF